MESVLNRALYKSAHTSGGCVDPDMQTGTYVCKRGHAKQVHVYVCKRKVCEHANRHVCEIHKCGHANRYMRMCVKEESVWTCKQARM